MIGPHGLLEMLAKAECALTSGPVSNDTLPKGAEVGVAGYSLQGFQGDLVVLFNFGDIPNDITVSLQDAPQDGVGDPPEAGDFVQATDSSGSNITATITNAVHEDTVLMWRVSKDVLGDYARIQVVNGSVSDADVAVTFLEMLPQYEDTQSHRSAGVFTEWK